MVWATAKKGPGRTSGFDGPATWAAAASSAPPSTRATPDPTNGYGDYQCSVFLVAGILAALQGREKTGEGDYVTCALQHAGIYTPGHGHDLRPVWQPLSEEPS